MKRITQAEALAQGYMIDTFRYPPLAYKGARYAPTDMRFCYNELEEKLMQFVRDKACLADEESHRKAALLGTYSMFDEPYTVEQAVLLLKELGELP
jgi:hypothetical protein